MVLSPLLPSCSVSSPLFPSVWPSESRRGEGGSAPSAPSGGGLWRGSLSARGLRSRPRFTLSISERQRQRSRERCCHYFSISHVIIAVPLPRSFFRQFFPGPPTPLPLHYILIPRIHCVTVGVQRLPGESQNSVLAEIFLSTLSPQEPVFTPSRCNAMPPPPMEDARLSSFMADVSDESHSAT